MSSISEQHSKDAYITILLNDDYLPGALLLAKTLKKTTENDVILLIDATGLSEKTLELVSEEFDKIIEIEPIISTSEKNLRILNRPDLFKTLTKIAIFDQTDYDFLIYLDCDVLPLKNLNGLFNILKGSNYDIAACAESSWPDIFNSGVLVLRPSKEIFEKLLIKSQELDSSFDGADQGLLNEFFLNKWLRLPYINNVTVNTNLITLENSYEYLPAYNRFHQDIKVLHFIGNKKPWFSRDIENYFTGNLKNFHKLWWEEFDKNYFGYEAGKIFEASSGITPPVITIPGESSSSLQDKYGKEPQAPNLAEEKLVNTWDLDIEEQNNEPILSDEVINEELPPPIFPWEAYRRDPTRVFTEIPEVLKGDFDMEQLNLEDD
ncbi:hypothetical protein PACTADRAFT_17861 [Pachysolen tannophilus NRRL Y-2460]|uniref:glycogenin glucosyltransferase n=1 Tax=Pachysolen tannophilus NRRL Y-2460 TaxID=669874 RepID=A0A1E4TQX2_PACTA|nr:hypothetical protein PACTADRAFT_17861 [Pachysolen tannophilus NRRL Y-2460]